MWVIACYHTSRPFLSTNGSQLTRAQGDPFSLLGLRKSQVWFVKSPELKICRETQGASMYHSEPRWALWPMPWPTHLHNRTSVILGRSGLDWLLWTATKPLCMVAPVMYSPMKTVGPDQAKKCRDSSTNLFIFLARAAAYKHSNFWRPLLLFFFLCFLLFSDGILCWQCVWSLHS